MRKDALDASHTTMTTLLEASPEELGIPSQAILRFLEVLAHENYCMHAFTLMRHGKVCFSAAAAPYTLDTPHRVFSAAKSVLVLSLLCAVSDGKIALTDKVSTYFPDMVDGNHDFDSMTVEDVLTMRTGQADDPFPAMLSNLDADLIRLFFETPPVEKPGLRFRYNNTVPHIVYALAERAVGIPFEAYQQARICEPLGVTVLAPTNSLGQYNPVVTAMSAKAMLAFAALFLQEGRWQNKQLIPAELVRQATACHTKTGLSENDAGYGYQIWRNAFGGYRMDGGWGQYAIVLPEYDVAAVILSDMPDSSLALKAFETNLLPHFSAEPLPADVSDAHRLKQYGREMTLAPEKGISESPLQHLWLEKVYHFPDRGISLCLNRETDKLTIVLQENERQTCFAVGLNGRWECNPVHMLVIPERTVDNGVYCLDADECYMSAAWRSANELLVTSKALSAQGRYLYTFTFDAQGLTLTLPERVCRGGNTQAYPTLCLQSEGRADRHAAKHE